MSKRKTISVDKLDFKSMSIEEPIVYFYSYTDEYHKLSTDIRNELDVLEEEINIRIESILQKHNYYKKRKVK
jgi:hypothetical protein